MNKEQVERHGKVIKWFCDNPDEGVWRRLESAEELWKLEYEPVFHTANEYTYVQNDSYSTLRKAQADGQSLQYLSKDHKEFPNQWLHKENNTDFFSQFKYRIKPIAPKFKSGDWVTLDNWDGENSMLESIHNGEEASGNYYSFSNGASINVNVAKTYNIKKWEPEEGERCVFWDDEHMSHYVIDRYQGINQNTPNAVHYKCTFDSFTNIAPIEFAQTLRDR